MFLFVRILSRQELENTPKSTLIDLVLSLAEQVQQMSKELEALKEQKQKNSTNSSKPPSTDSTRKSEKNKPQPKSQRKKTGKNKGGQKGHKGSNLPKEANPDFIQEHKLNDLQCKCGGLFKESGYQSRQVFDIPPVNIEVTEHRAFNYQCSCCNTKAKASFPKDIKSSTQYGQNLKSLSIYLSNYQLIPYARLKEFIYDLCGLNIRTGTLANFNKTAG